MKTKFFLLLFTLLLFSIPASALVFSPFNGGTTAGQINTGNHYFNDDAFFYGYTGDRNVFIVSESNSSWIFEPISGTSLQVINSSLNTITDSVVHNGYVYFIDGTTLKKKTTRNVNNYCESTDSSAGGCIRIIATSVGPTLRVYQNVLYYIQAPNTLKHLDSNDNAVTNFAMPPLTAGMASTRSFVVVTSGGALAAYASGDLGADIYSWKCTSAAGCVAFSGALSSSIGQFTDTYYATTSYVYVKYYLSTSGENAEYIRLISNDSKTSVTYATGNVNILNRAFVGSKSTIGLMSTATTYETYNSNEVGSGSSTPTSPGSGVVTYTNKEIDVPNDNYYNDSVIPINIALRFIISDANKTNYTSSLFWHVKINDPLGIQVFDLNLPGIACTQQTPWWDVLGIFTDSDWACDGSGSIEYTRTPGQFWLNGSYEVFLTEQLPGQTFILDTDTYNIVNQTSNNPGTIIQPPSCPTCGVSTPGTITVTTALTIIAVLGQIAFWGLILWLGIIFTTIRIMTKNGAAVSSHGLIAVAWLAAVFIALVGLFGAYKIYVIVLSTIIAAVMFKFGQKATTGSE